jgi:hypothetical protein
LANYLIVGKGLNAIPDSLREFVKKRVTEEYKSFNVELDFSEKRPSKDLTITFTSELPMTPIYGESVRIEMTTGAATAVGSGNSSVFVRALQVTRIDNGSGGCDTAFPESEAQLGEAIVYVTVHEVGHMLGLDSGGSDGAGHSTDSANWMWDPGSLPGPTREWVFDYTVVAGDSLAMIVMRYKHGTLTPCHIGPDALTADGVWGHPRNKTAGFIADPDKGKNPAKRANNPSFIYAGEKVALFNYNVKSPTFRGSVPMHTGKKSFTTDQQATITKFISDRLAILP